jgi:hypothetical protein
MVKRRHLLRHSHDAFTRLQVLSDLSATIAHLGCFPQVPVPEPTVMSAAIGTPTLDDSALESLRIAAASPEHDGSVFCCATAVLLADGLAFDVMREDFLWHRDLFWNDYRAAPPPIRAALMNGFRYAVGRGLLAEELRPSFADCATYDPADLVKPLREIARALSPEERNAVARADSYGTKTDVERHLLALNRMLDEDDCQFPEDVWFPLEAVELASWSPAYPGFEACIALLLHDSLTVGVHHGEDRQGALRSRWAVAGAQLCALPEPVRSTLLAGFRHVFETRDDDSTDWIELDRHLRKPPLAIPWEP